MSLLSLLTLLNDGNNSIVKIFNFWLQAFEHLSRFVEQTGVFTYERCSKSSMRDLGFTVTLFTSLWSPSSRNRKNSWASCWLQDQRTEKSVFNREFQAGSKPHIKENKSSTWYKSFYSSCNLLVTNKSRGIFLNLHFEVRRADGLAASGCPKSLSELGKLWNEKHTFGGILPKSVWHVEIKR